MIRRYNSYELDDSMQESCDGEYIHYNDYNTLLQRFKNIVDYMDGMNIVLKLDLLECKIKHEKEFIKEIEE